MEAIWLLCDDAVSSHPGPLLGVVYLSDNVVTCSNDDINAMCFMFTIEDLTDPCIHWACGMYTAFFIWYATPNDDYLDEFALIGDHHYPFVTAPCFC